MKEIALTQGQVALVDDEDFERVMALAPWYALWYPECQLFKAVRNGKENGKPIIILMHRFVLDAPTGKEVDHRNHNTLDNQRENLRICTRSQNMGNVRKQTDRSSRFKGVSWYKRYQKWHVSICKDYNQQSLGYFTDEENAARAYNKAALEHFGEFAYLNEVTDD